MTNGSLPEAFTCPMCTAAVNRTVTSHCTNCGIDLNDPAIAQVFEADAALATFQSRYDELAARWQQWISHREALIDHLNLTRIDPRYARPVQPPEPQQHQNPAPSPATMAPHPDDAVAQEPAPAEQSVAQEEGEPQPVRSPVAVDTVSRPAPERHTPRILTAPVLLGVSGASLLIAAAVVFVAITWETFFPLGQGLLILAVSAGVATLALWLKRLTLVITSGAVGVVAMAFAGISVIAFDREAQLLGTFTTPIALLVTCAAGLVLARLMIRWVNATSALALIGAAVGFTAATVAETSASTGVVWALAGAGTAAITAATTSLWRGKPARAIIRWGVVAWLSLSAVVPLVFAAVAWNASATVAPAALAPLAVLVALMRWWPRLSAAPLVFLAPWVGTVAAVNADAQWWAVASIFGASLAVVVAARRYLPQSAIHAVGLALTPGVVGMVVVALAAIAALVSNIAADWGTSALAADAGVEFDTGLWSGVATVTAALAVLMFRLHKPEGWTGRVPMLGPVLVVAGLGGVAYGVADVIAPGQANGYALALTCAAVIAAATGLVWAQGSADRLVYHYLAIAVLVAAEIYGVFALYRVEVMWWAGVLIAVAPLVALVVLSRLHPRAASAPVAFLAPLVGAAVVANIGGSGWQQFATLATVAALTVAVARWMPSTVRNSVMVSVSPALAALVVVAGLQAVAMVVTIGVGIIDTVTGLSASVPDVLNLWAAFAAAAGGLACFATRSWPTRPGWWPAIDVAGSIMVTTAWGVLALAATRDFLPDHAGTIVVAASVAAAGMVASMALWEGRNAQRVSRWTAIVFLTLAGLHGSFTLASGDTLWWSGLLIALTPLAVLAVLAVWWPRLTLGSVALTLTAVAMGLTVNLGGTPVQTAVAAAAVVAAVLWGGVTLPRAWKVPIIAGLAPALVWALAVSLWSVVALIERLTLGTTELGLDLWVSATAALTGIAFGALPHWRLPQFLMWTTSILGAVVVICGAAALTLVMADAWGSAALTSLSLSGLVAALAAAGFIVLWSTSAARWTNGIGAAVLLTVAGVNGAFAFADPSTTWWFALSVALLPIAVLVGFGRWWPRIVLGPAAFLFTVIAAATAARLDIHPHGWVAFALVATAALAWSAPLLSPRRRLPILAGLVPAMSAGVLHVGVLTGIALARMLSGATGLIEPQAALWAGASMVALALVMAASRTWEVSVLVTRTANVLGAIASVSAAVTFTTFAAVQWPGDAVVTAAAGLGASLVAAVTMKLWVTRAARWTAGLGALAWFTIAALNMVADIAASRVEWWHGLAVIAAAVAVLVAAARWWPAATLGPASLLVTWSALAAVAGHGLSFEVVVFAAATAVAVVTWVAHFLHRKYATPVMYGAALVASLTAAVLVFYTLVGLGRMVTTAFGGESTDVSTWILVSAAVAFGAILAWKPARAHLGWVALPFVFLAAANVPSLWAWSVLAGFALVAIAVGPRRRVTSAAAITYSLLACVWAAYDSGVFATAAAVTTVVALWSALRDTGWRRSTALVLAPVSGALATSMVAVALDAGADVAVALAMGTVLTMPIVAAAFGLDPRRTIAVSVVAVGTVAVPWFAPSVVVAGATVLLAGAAWLALAALGVVAGRLVSVAVLSVGSALILADADVAIIEAYTAVPAVGLLAVGLWWMYDRPEVHTLKALGPGLSMALVPSFVAMVLQPDSLARTLILTAATIALALLGVLLKWFAPILATAVTAVVVAVTQIVAGDNLAIQVILSAIVGAVLMVIASTYERLKELR